jgi:membrane dipeptidase
MQWIDGHLDLAYIQLLGRDLTAPCSDPDVGCISLPELRDAGVELTFATIFTEPASDASHPQAAYGGIDDLDGAEAAGRRQLEVYRRLETQGELCLVRSRTDLKAPAGRGPRIVLLMEGADPIRDPRQVATWFDDGLRMVGLTWAMGTRYAGGNHRLGPLTDLGIDLVNALDECGMIHDASHLSDEAFDGLMKVAQGPVVATHSNCRALVGRSQRHLRDDQIGAIAERDGVVGLNLFSKFLVPSGRATIDDCVAHVQRVSELMGHRRGVALGSDMDGGFGPDSLPEHLDHPTKLDALADALTAAGWSNDEVNGFAHGNWQRFLERTLPQEKEL